MKIITIYHYQNHKIYKKKKKKQLKLYRKFYRCIQTDNKKLFFSFYYSALQPGERLARHSGELGAAEREAAAAADGPLGVGADGGGLH